MLNESAIMIIPYDMLSKKALDNLVEEYVTRDGTDYTDLEIKKNEIRSQLKSKKLVISYDEITNSSNIIEFDFKSKIK